MRRRLPLATIAATALITAGVTAFARNFISGERKIKRRVAKRYGIADPQFERAMGQLLGPPILAGNCVQPLRNGAEIFPAMLAAIAAARITITFETFIFHQGEVAESFAAALAARARDGVKVHVLLDGFGCDCVLSPMLRRMVEAGVELEVYHTRNFARVNHRTHRKLLIIDGRLGFTGGVGVADEWLGNAEDSEHWRDSHFRVEEPVVAQMQAGFLDNWMKTHATVLHGEDYFPELKPVGPHRCQMFKSSPMEGSESARLIYILSIAAADHSIRIGNAYFVPDDLTTETLAEAADRGVAVEVMVPGSNIDSMMVRGASRHRWGYLLKKGVRIFQFEPTMYHCKCMIIDDLWTSVGSANFDNRSFRLNDEANLNIIDAQVAAGEVRAFEADKQRCREITLADWNGRPLWRKGTDAAASMFRSQL